MQGLELLTADGLTDKAGHLRQALQMYLRHFGITAAPARPPQPNGHQQEKQYAV
jgi:hypothetical protein